MIFALESEEEFGWLLEANELNATNNEADKIPVYKYVVLIDISLYYFYNYEIVFKC